MLFFNITAGAVLLISILYAIITKSSPPCALRTIWSGLTGATYLWLCALIYSVQMGDFLPLHSYEINKQLTPSPEFPEIFLTILYCAAILVGILMIISMIKKSPRLNNIFFNVSSITLIFMVAALALLLIVFQRDYLSMIVFLPLYLPIFLSILTSAFQSPGKKSQFIKSFIVYGFSAAISLVFIISQLLSVIEFPAKLSFFLLISFVLILIPGINLAMLFYEHKKVSKANR